MDDMLKHNIGRIVNEYNNRDLPEFEGYSPLEMQFIVYDPLGEGSPIQLLELPERDYDRIPILKQIKYLLKIIEEAGELKLTAKGFLPTKIVSDIYAQGFIKDEMIEAGISKLYKETDAKAINLTRILAELSRVVKKRNGKLSLTKKGREQLNDNHRLLENVFKTFGMKFNWGYYDGYDNDIVGQLGFGFSLILVSKYGSEKRLDLFYAEKYLSAFPMLIEQMTPSRYRSNEEQAARCYALRTFERFLDYFGIIKIEPGPEWNSPKSIEKTELYDKLIKVRPPGYVYKA